jgi:hypothetical protein
LQIVVAGYVFARLSPKSGGKTAALHLHLR